jgi:hypothetical protein
MIVQIKQICAIAKNSFKLAALLTIFGICEANKLSAETQLSTVVQNPLPARIHTMELNGYIWNKQIFEFVNAMFEKYFDQPFIPPSNRRVANFLQVYLGPDVVLNGEFQHPKGVITPKEIVSTLQNSEHPNNGCFVQRINFEIDNGSIVLVVFNSNLENQGVLEQCMLLAFARVVGGEVFETQAKPLTELKKLILSLTPTDEV